ncbi:MAG: SGNH/GDSL hydrolase family protein [Candidatus Eisenbacteria bacterium]|nr:SGNH/GDSL hydrolase family protein [Candidatus Eisenbacteria bacterium]
MGRWFNWDIVSKSLLVLFSLVVSLAACEVALRTFAPIWQRYYFTWPPGLRQPFNPDPAVLPGVRGPAPFAINADGIRGDPFSPRQRYRILAIGGSTTECAYLDSAEAWPHLLQDDLNRALGRPVVWVGNLGRSGNTTRCSRLQVRDLVPSYPRIDAIVLLVGVNDLQFRLMDGDHFQPYRQVAAMYDPTMKPFFKRTEIWRRLHLLKTDVRQRLRHELLTLDESGHRMILARRQRRAARRVLRDLPDLTSALEEYVENIHAIVDAARARHLRAVFLTQPALWSPGLPRGLDSLLWFGRATLEGEGSRDYYSVEALAAGMERYNDALRATCRSRGVECIDLAAMLPRDTTVFYDDCHFNESGARKVAAILTDYFTRSGALSGVALRAR